MAGPDATAAAQLARPLVRPRHLAFLDFAGDPVRATTWHRDITFGASETGEADLDGHTFLALDPALVKVSELNFGERGAETMTMELSGLSLNPADADRYTLLLDDSNWLLRRAVLYRAVADAANVQQGAFWRRFLGRMTNVTVRGSAAEQVITVTVKSARALLSRARGRGYLDQSVYDPADRSAEAAIGAANLGAAVRPSLPGGTGGGPTATRRENLFVRPV